MWSFGDPGEPQSCFPVFEGQTGIACPPLKQAWQHCLLAVPEALAAPFSPASNSPSLPLPSFSLSILDPLRVRFQGGDRAQAEREKAAVATAGAIYTVFPHADTHGYSQKPPNGGLHNHANPLTCMMLNRREAFISQ